MRSGESDDNDCAEEDGDRTIDDNDGEEEEEEEEEEGEEGEEGEEKGEVDSDNSNDVDGKLGGSGGVVGKNRGGIAAGVGIVVVSVVVVLVAVAVAVAVVADNGNLNCTDSNSVFVSHGGDTVSCLGRYWSIVPQTTSCTPRRVSAAWRTWAVPGCSKTNTRNDRS
jgi:hypothetical protein